MPHIIDNILSSISTKYQKPSNGIPYQDLDPSATTSILAPSNILNGLKLANGLITNGSGQLGNTSILQNSTFVTQSVIPGAFGSFSYTRSPTDSNNPVLTQDFIQIMADSAYSISASVCQVTQSPGTIFYAGFASFDAEQKSIGPGMVLRRPETDTTLAAPLAPGDTTIQLTSAANWNTGVGGSENYVLFFTYVDSSGRVYDRQTNPYTRYSTHNSVEQWSNTTGVNGNTITLKSPFSYANPAVGSNGIWPIGTPISAGRQNTVGSYNYPLFASTKLANNQWTTSVKTISGVELGGQNNLYKFWAGTAYIKLVFFPNYNGLAGDKILISNISLIPVPSKSTIGIEKIVSDNGRIKFTTSSGDPTDVPIQFALSPNTATPQAGALEYDGSTLYLTDKNAKRNILSPQLYIGGNMIANASLATNTNINFSGWLIERGYTPEYSSICLLLPPSNSTTDVQIGDEKIPIIGNADIKFTCTLVFGNIGGTNNYPDKKQHIYLNFYDGDGEYINDALRENIPGAALTTLAADLKNGDTTFTLTDSTGWIKDTNLWYNRRIKWWPLITAYNIYGYRETTGKIHKAYTYTRSISKSDVTLGGTWSSVSGNIFTLNADIYPNGWDHGLVSAGTPVQNGIGGGSRSYIFSETVPTAGEKQISTIISKNGTPGVNRIPHGASFLQIGGLFNYDGTAGVSSEVRIGNIKLTYV